MATHAMKHPGLADRLTRANPGHLVPSGTVRGIFVTMLERFPLDDFRIFWRALPVVLDGQAKDEAEGYRYLWEDRGMVHAHYVDQVNAALQDFLFDRGLSHERFFDEMHFRFKLGGMWSARESLDWIHPRLQGLYRDPDPKIILLRLVCDWTKKAFTGASSELPFFRMDEDRVEAIYSFAPDGNFKFRCPFFFSRSTIIGMRLFPKFLGLTPFEEVTLMADCLHPDDILRGASWEIVDGIFLIEGRPHGRLIAFSEWARPLALRFIGNPVPDRQVILIETEYRCAVRNTTVLSKGCIYDAPLFLARVVFPRTYETVGQHLNPAYLANILEALSLDNSPEWLEHENRYREFLEIVEEKLVIEYRRVSQSIFIDGRQLISGVPAMLLAKILAGWVKGQSRFDYLAFKHDRAIFPDPKRSSFETRWSRLKEKLASDCPAISLERVEKGEFEVSVRCPIVLHEVG